MDAGRPRTAQKENPAAGRNLLLKTLARLAHQRHGLGEDRRHQAADLLGLLFGVALHVDAVDRRDGHLHGEAADRAICPPEIAGARTLAYDRRGYGESGAPEPYARTTVAEQAEDLAALVRAVDAAPAVAAGADLGALVVLDVLKRHAGVLRAAVLVDPPVFQLVREALEPLAAERLLLEEALRDGGRER